MSLISLITRNWFDFIRCRKLRFAYLIISVSPLSFSSRIAGSKRVIMLYKISDRNTASMKTILAKKMPVKGESGRNPLPVQRFY